MSDRCICDHCIMHWQAINTPLRTIKAFLGWSMRG